MRMCPVENPFKLSNCFWWSWAICLRQQATLSKSFGRTLKAGEADASARISMYIFVSRRLILERFTHIRGHHAMIWGRILNFMKSCKVNVLFILAPYCAALNLMSLQRSAHAVVDLSWYSLLFKFIVQF